MALLLNNASNTTAAATTENWLKTVLAKYPEVKREYIFQRAEELDLPLVQRFMGLGQVYAPSMSGKTRQNYNSMLNSVGGDQLSWPVMPLNQYTFTVVSYAGSLVVGGTAANVAGTIRVNVSWLQEGMTILVPIAGGVYQRFYINGAGVSAGSGNYDYSAKFVSSSTTETIATPLYGFASTSGSWNGQLSADCATSGSAVPIQAANLYTNWTGITRLTHQVCRSAYEAKVWFSKDGGAPGSELWTTEEERQMEQRFYAITEMTWWYGVRTYQSYSTSNFVAVNTPYLTNSGGNTLKSGDGIFAQIATGNITQFSVNTYINQPSTYETFRLTVLKQPIIKWALSNGVKGANLLVYTGVGGFDHLNEVLKGFAATAGGGIALKMKDYENGKWVECNYTGYTFAGFNLFIKKVNTFDDPNMQSMTTTSSSGISMATYQYVIMPESLANGMPVIEAYFKGGIASTRGVIEKIIPGMITPGHPETNIGSNAYDGYTVEILSENMVVVNDPSKILWLQPIA